MRNALLAAAAITLALGGSAFAQATQSISGSNATESRTGGTTGADYFTDPAMVGSFYTDDTMTTLRPVEDLRTAYMDMTEADREALRIQCEQEANRGTEGTALCTEIQNF